MKNKEEKSTKMEYDFEKDLYYSISSIENLQKELAFKTKSKGHPINETYALSKKKKKGGFKIKFFLDDLYDHKYVKKHEKFGIYDKILLEKSNGNYYVNKDSIIKSSILLGYPQVLTIEVNNFQLGENKDFDNKLLRLIIPTSIEASFSLFQAKSLHISGTTTFWGLVGLNIANKNYHLYKHTNSDTDKHYLIIDSCEENDFEEFKTITNAILIGFGFITGNLFQDEYFYQTIRKDGVTITDYTAYEKKEPSIISNAELFNPREFLEYLEYFKKEKLEDKEEYYLSSTYFSKIVENIFESKTFSRCLTLILEGNQTKFLLLRASIYSIALETLTNLIYINNQDKINPISDPKLATLLKEKFGQQVEEYEPFISDYGLQIISAKINDLNKPTNSKKLTMPFKIYDIKLSKEDVKILNHRNKFLHGTTPFKEELLDEKQKELKYISSKLLSLINCLSLRYCGYHGHVKDYGSWHQLYWEDKVTDHLFKVI